MVLIINIKPVVPNQCLSKCSVECSSSINSNSNNNYHYYYLTGYSKPV